MKNLIFFFLLFPILLFSQGGVGVGGGNGAAVLLKLGGENAIHTENRNDSTFFHHGGDLIHNTTLNTDSLYFYRILHRSVNGELFSKWSDSIQIIPSFPLYQKGYMTSYTPTGSTANSSIFIGDASNLGLSSNGVTILSGDLAGNAYTGFLSEETVMRQIALRGDYRHAIELNALTGAGSLTSDDLAKFYRLKLSLDVPNGTGRLAFRNTLPGHNEDISIFQVDTLAASAYRVYDQTNDYLFQTRWEDAGVRTTDAVNGDLHTVFRNGELRWDKYPQSRNDVGTPINLISTDAVGNVESHPISEVIVPPYLAKNGLNTFTPNTYELGGFLNKNTEINGDVNTFNIDFVDLDSFTIRSANNIILDAPKLTITGVIDPPTGMEMVPQVSNPAFGGMLPANTVWINSANGHLYRGSVDLEAYAPPATGASGSLSSDYAGLISETIGVAQHDRPIFTGTGVRLTVTSNLDFTGMAAAADNTFFLIYNVGPAEIKFKHNNNNSSIGNRFFTVNSGDFILHEFASVYVRYDALLDGGNGGWHLVEMQH